MANFFQKIFTRRRPAVYGVSLTAGDGRLSVFEIEKAVATNHMLRAVHSVIAGGAGRLAWKVEGPFSESRTLTLAADASMGKAMADWLVCGRAAITSAFSNANVFDDNAIIVENPDPVLTAARSLVLKIQELERAERQAFWRQGAMAFVAVRSASSGLVPTAQEVEALQREIDALRRGGGAGGVAVTPVPFEVQRLDGVALRDYGFVEQRVMLIRELCNLFRIDSSLLNDPENKTYSNKTEAEKSLYVNVIIPEAYRFCFEVNKVLMKTGAQYVLKVDVSVVEPIAEERHKTAEQVLQLLAAGVISREEARQMLLSAGVIPDFEK